MKKNNRKIAGRGFQITAFSVLFVVLLLVFIRFTDVYIKQKSTSGNVLTVEIQTAAAAAICIFTAAAIIHDRKQNRILSEALENEKKMGVIDALSNEYENLFLLDPESRKVEIFRSVRTGLHDDALSLLENSRDYDILIAAYTDAFVYADDRIRVSEESSVENIFRSVKDKSIYRIDYKRIRDDGFQYYQMNFALLNINISSPLIVCGFRNVDEMVRSQQRQERLLRDALNQANVANKAKSEFLSVMSHDIRTPLNGIIGMTYIASENQHDSERVRECLEKISSSGKYLLGLVNEILDMSCIEAGKSKLVCENFDIYELTQSIVNVYYSSAEVHRQTFELSINKPVNTFVSGDSVRIQQIYGNLISNAVKYTQDSGIIKISFSQLQHDTEAELSGLICYEFAVEDNGMGMSPEYLDEIFEMFSRESDSRINRIQGTGLGLPIARKFAQMMNGDITVESEAGKGSRFSVQIRLKAAESVPASDTAAEYEPVPDLSGKRILIAEDNTLNAEIAQNIFIAAGAETELAETGDQAVRMVREHDEYYYSMIFMDIRMPVMDGYEAAEAIRSAGTDYMTGIPIIAMTADAFESDVKHAVKCGMNGHIAKPIEPEKIWSIIRTRL